MRCTANELCLESSTRVCWSSRSSAVRPWCSRYFSSPPASSGPRHTWDQVQAQGNAPEIPRRAVFLASLMCSREGGDSLESCLAGGGDYRRLVRGEHVASPSVI